MAFIDVPNPVEKEPAIQFPVTHGKCPVCGSTRGVYQETVEKLKKDGTLPPGYDLKGVALQAPLIDGAHPPTILAAAVKVKILQMTLEICAEPNCGAIYCTNLTLLDGIGKAQPIGMAPPAAFKKR